jgi:hypothetical protein
VVHAPKPSAASISEGRKWLVGQGSGGNPAPPAGATPPHQHLQLQAPRIEVRDDIGGILTTYIEIRGPSNDYTLLASLHIMLMCVYL